MTTETINTAAALLAQGAPTTVETPARIEALNLCSFDVSAEINNLTDAAGRHEEQAATDAATESNDARRKARRAELLRANDEYNNVRAEIQTALRLRVQLDERAARLRREYRLALIQLEQKGASR